MKFLYTILSLAIVYTAQAQQVLSSCKSETGKWGFCNAEGKVIIPQKYEDVSKKFWENTFAFTIDGVLPNGLKKWNVINTQGTVLCSGNEVGILSKNLIWYLYTSDIFNVHTNKNERQRDYRIIAPNKTKEQKDNIEKVVLSVEPKLIDGLVYIRTWKYNPTEKREYYLSGYLNEIGDWAIPLTFGNKPSDWLDSKFSEGLVGYKKDGVAGFMNPKGEQVFKLDEPYEKIISIGRFSNGLALISLKAGAESRIYYFVDKTGKKVIDLGELKIKKDFVTNDDITVLSFKGGIAPVYKDSKWGFINTAGKTAIDFQFDGFGTIHYQTSDEVWDEFALLNVKKGDLWGCINTKGEVVIPFLYYTISGNTNKTTKKSYIKVEGTIEGKFTRGKYELNENGQFVFTAGSF